MSTRSAIDRFQSRLAICRALNWVFVAGQALLIYLALFDSDAGGSGGLIGWLLLGSAGFLVLYSIHRIFWRCPACEHALPEHMGMAAFNPPRFCRHCGVALVVGSTPPPAPVRIQATSRPAPVIRKGFVVTLLAVIGAGLLIALRFAAPEQRDELLRPFFWSVIFLSGIVAVTLLMLRRAGTCRRCGLPGSRGKYCERCGEARLVGYESR